jgi:hypothetical protein
VVVVSVAKNQAGSAIARDANPTNGECVNFLLDLAQKGVHESTTKPFTTPQEVSDNSRGEECTWSYIVGDKSLRKGDLDKKRSSTQRCLVKSQNWEQRTTPK